MTLVLQMKASMIVSFAEYWLDKQYILYGMIAYCNASSVTGLYLGFLFDMMGKFDTKSSILSMNKLNWIGYSTYLCTDLFTFLSTISISVNAILSFLSFEWKHLCSVFEWFIFQNKGNILVINIKTTGYSCISLFSFDIMSVTPDVESDMNLVQQVVLLEYSIAQWYYYDQVKLLSK